jgi:lipid-binding SYLF domain-containing protein
MKFFVVPVLISSFLLFAPIGAKAEMGRIDAATQVLDQLPGMIPAPVLKHAQGIAIIPGALKAGFIFGGELGSGVLVRRLQGGSWSPPAMISLVGGTFGLQIGGEVRNIVLILNSRRSVDYIENGTLNLGGDVGVVAGPVGGDFGVGTAVAPDVYAYVSSFGAFAGATVEGSSLSMDWGANRDLYGVSDPLRLRLASVPGPVRNFSCALASVTGSRAKFCA